MLGSLFDREADAPVNLLPYDGTVLYFGNVFPKELADPIFRRLLNEIHWKHDEVVIFGKSIETRREVAWYGDRDFSYTYSGKTKTAALFTPLLLQLRQKTEELTQETYNSCLLNLYHDGSEGMGYHNDREKDLAKHHAIAALSFGAERRFCFRHRITKEKKELFLEHGSLLVMKDEIQDYWLHSLPEARKIVQPRVSLTFRKVAE